MFVEVRKNNDDKTFWLPVDIPAPKAESKKSKEFLERLFKGQENSWNDRLFWELVDLTFRYKTS